MDRTKRRPQFQIRKVPLRRSPPEKTPQLNALDVHSICLPSRNRKDANWGTLSENHYQEEVNPQIIYSPTYQQLYSNYLALKEQHSQQRSQAQKEVEAIEAQISLEEDQKTRLHTMRNGLYMQVEQLREGLNQVRDKNYNLRWEIYHQRGAHYMNINGFSLFQGGGEMSYEELLQMEEQMGSVPKGLSEEEIAQIPSSCYRELRKPQQDSEQNEEICCICFDELEEADEILKLACRHLHHKECLRDWLLKQRVCPICKQEIVPSEIAAQKTVPSADLRARYGLV